MIKAGIYMITTPEGNLLGRSTDLLATERDHMLALKNSYHYSPNLQKAYDKHGATNCSFKVVEYVMSELLLESAYMGQATKLLPKHMVERVKAMSEVPASIFYRLRKQVIAA